MAGGSFSVRIRQDTLEVDKMLRGLKNGSNRVITTALNKTAKNVEVVAVKSIAKEFGMLQKLIRPRNIKIYNARWRYLSAEIVAKGSRIPVSQLKPKEEERGFSYIGKGGKRTTITSAFEATMRSGHNGVFTRSGRKRLPINEKHGVSVPFLFVKKQLTIAMDSRGAEMWEKNLDHALKRFIDRLK